MNEYEAKQERRRERLEARAARLAAKASAEFRKADLREEASGIPFGQPILVGHHSERRHRNAIARAHAAMGRGVALDKAAQAAAAAAEGVGSAGISSDDPDAVAKLKAKLAALEERVANEKRWNKQIAAGKIAEMDAPEAVKAEVARMVEKWPYMARGYFHVSNRQANIRDVKARIARLEAAAARAPAAPVEAAGGVRIVQNAEANRVQILFPDKPSADARAILKSRGFRWSPSEKAWQRHLNNAGIYAAECAVKEIEKIA